MEKGVMGVLYEETVILFMLKNRLHSRAQTYC